MILYFSGTGNSLWVAGRLSQALGQAKPVSVADELRRHAGDAVCEYGLRQDEPLILVFPVHSWGLAAMMLRFVSRLSVRDYAGQKVYAVCTCGDTCGWTDRILGEALRKRHLPLTGCWSVRMPNNYILMKGFGVDPDDVREAKLAAAPAAVDAVAAAIRNGDTGAHLTVGTQPWLKSGPDSRTKFRVSEACIGCGLCERVCPTGTVTMKEGRPEWGRGCVQCTACINRCPVRAIDWDGITQNQGRYHYPGL